MNLQCKVWLGCYASYNDGYLFDKQYTIEDTIDLDAAKVDFEKHVLASIKKARPEWEKDGYITETYAEEIYMADYEVYIDDEFIKTEFGECISSLETFIDEITDFKPNYPIALYTEVAKNIGLAWDELSQVDDKLIIQVDSNSDSDFGYAMAELYCIFDGNENETLETYFDYESYGHSMKMDFTLYEVGNDYYAVSDQ